MNEEKLTLDRAQILVDEWIKTIGVRYFSELTNMAVLTEEVGELARVMARVYGDQSFKEGESANLGEEMAGINLEKEFLAKFEKRTERDSERHKNNHKLQ
jgi:NTP pyrophosphatase (non-canonical NTP hydrolase)